MANNQNIYSVYTPLRNFLRKQDIAESLLAIHAHTQHQLFSKRLPNYIVGAPISYVNARSFSDFIDTHLFSWDLAVLAKEVIINGKSLGVTRSLKNWRDLSCAVNKLKNIDSKIAQEHLGTETFLQEFHRIAHRQFQWQAKPSFQTLARYWQIYLDKELSKVIEASFGLTIEKILIISVALFGFFINKFALFYPPKISLRNIESNDVDIFLKHFCKDIEDLKQMMINGQEINEKFLYSLNLLVVFPLVKLQYQSRPSIACPIPKLFFDRVSSGIYYEIYSTKGFDGAFGYAFQSYIGSVLEKALNDDFYIIEEENYGTKKAPKRSIDWTVKRDNEVFFVECKAKRMRLEAKAEILTDEILRKQLIIIADSIIQVYETLIDYEANLYPNFKFDGQRKHYLIIATLEEWYLFGDKLIPILDRMVSKKMEEKQLPVELVEKYPYLVCSAVEFEELVQVINLKGSISGVLEEKFASEEYKMWNTALYLRHKFPSELNQTSGIFEDEFDKFIEKSRP